LVGVAVGLFQLRRASRSFVAPGLWWNAIVLAGGVYLLINAFVGRNRLLRRAWRGMPNLQVGRRIDMEDDRIVVDDSQSRTEYKWGAFTRYVESANVFSLMPNELQFVIVPKRALGGAAEVDAFRRLLDVRVARPAVPGFPVAALPSAPLGPVADGDRR
jgi:hypothetical protein